MNGDMVGLNVKPRLGTMQRMCKALSVTLIYSWGITILKCSNSIYLTESFYMLLTAVITEAEEGGFIAFNPETGTTTQGESYQEAIQNLKEATSLYLNEFPMKIHAHPVMTTFEISHA